MANADEEKEWIRRAREGDHQAYRLLVERHQSRIYGLVARFLGPGHGGIEDVVQDVFVRAYFSLGKFRGNASFGTWVYRIAINRSRDEMRKESGVFPLDEALLDPRALSWFSDEPNSAEKEPPEAPEEIKRWVAHALAALPEKLRIVLTLKDMEGKSYGEVSQILGRSVGTIKSRHARARARLREKLSPHLPALKRRGTHEL